MLALVNATSGNTASSTPWPLMVPPIPITDLPVGQGAVAMRLEAESTAPVTATRCSPVTTLAQIA